MNSNFPSATGGGIGGGPPPADGWTVEKLSIPAAFFIGGPGDVAYTLSNATYAATPATAQVIKANLPEAGHYGAYAKPLPEWVTAVSGWLDWQLKGDTKAKAEIWSEMDKFNAAATKMQEEMVKFNAAAKGGNRIGSLLSLSPGSPLKFPIAPSFSAYTFCCPSRR